MKFSFSVFCSDLKLLNPEDVEFGDDGFPLFMENQLGEIAHNYQGDPKMMFKRHVVYYEKNGKSRERSESVRDSNKKGGLNFKTEIIHKLQRFRVINFILSIF